MSKVLVVAAHPDDELLGVGATVKKYVNNGDEVRAVILGEGQTSRFTDRKDAPTSLVNELHKNTLQAAEKVGFSKVEFADFPDNRFDHVDLLDIVKWLEKIIDEYKPDVVYTHHAKDLNIDHQRTYEAVLTAARTVNTYTVKKIYAFSTLSSTEWNFGKENAFVPNVFVDVEDTLEYKLEAMKCYESELCEYPHPRSIEGMKIQAQFYGNIVGKKYVEAFELVREVI